MRLHYLAAGEGEPVILLHGYAQNSHMWRPLIAELAKTNTVIAPDLARLRPVVQAGNRYDQPPKAMTKNRWRKIFMRSPLQLGLKRVRIAGHDIGLMVAYAYAAQYPAEVERIV